MTLKKKIGISALAVLLAGLVTGSAIGIANYVNSDGSDSTISGYEVSADETSSQNLTVSTGKSRGITLTSTTLTASSTTPTYVSGDYVLTASYNSDATNPKFTWTSSDTTSITLTPSSDTKSCTVTCNSAFSSQITITCTAVDNESVYATCTVDYYKRASVVNYSLPVSSSSTLGIAGTIGSSSESSGTWTPEYSETQESVRNTLSVGELAIFTYGSGTLTETYTVTGVDMTFNHAVTNYQTLDWLNYSARSCPALIMYACGGTSPLTDDGLTSCYNVLYYAYYTNSWAMKVTVTFTGDITGVEYSYTGKILINPENMYVTVSSTSLNNTALAY